MAELVLKDESFQLMGLMFRVHRQLGPSCKEKNYQDAIEMILKREAISYEREKEVYIPFEGEKLGGFFIDFLVWGKIILEVKSKPFITHEDVRQVMRYLQATGVPLALLVNFKREKVEYKRVINSNARTTDSSLLDSSKLEKISGKLVKYLGIDWGEKRIGLALADGETKIATPFKIVADVEEVALVVESEQIDMVIIGKPISISNFQFPISKQFENFLNELKSKINVPLELVDERLSSKAADALPGNKKTKSSRDQIAAMLILQSWIDTNLTNKEHERNE